MKLTSIITTLLKTKLMQTVWEIIAQAVLMAEEQGGTGADKRKAVEQIVKKRLAQIKANPTSWILNLLIELAVAQMNLTGDQDTPNP